MTEKDERFEKIKTLFERLDLLTADP